MDTLLPEQIDALRDLDEVGHTLPVDIVIIGATALRLWWPHVRD